MESVGREEEVNVVLVREEGEMDDLHAPVPSANVATAAAAACVVATQRFVFCCLFVLFFSLFLFSFFFLSVTLF